MLRPIMIDLHLIIDIMAGSHRESTCERLHTDGAGRENAEVGGIEKFDDAASIRLTDHLDARIIEMRDRDGRSGEDIEMYICIYFAQK